MLEAIPEQRIDKFREAAEKIIKLFKVVAKKIKKIWKNIVFVVVRAYADPSKRDHIDKFRKIQLRTKSSRIHKKQNKRILKMVFNN